MMEVLVGNICNTVNDKSQARKVSQLTGFDQNVGKTFTQLLLHLYELKKATAQLNICWENLRFVKIHESCKTFLLFNFCRVATIYLSYKNDKIIGEVQAMSEPLTLALIGDHKILTSW